MVRVKSKLSFPYTSNKQINLDEKGCTLRDRTPVTCTQLAVCMEYDGVGADDVIGKLRQITTPLTFPFTQK